MGVFSSNNCNFVNRDGVRETPITLPFSLLTGPGPLINAMVYTGAPRNAKLKKKKNSASCLHSLRTYLVKRQPQLCLEVGGWASVLVLALPSPTLTL